MKKILFLKLKILAKLTLVKYRPKIIAITGSVGKTSTKEAIFSVLESHFSVRKSSKNFNNEIGTPLTIMGFDRSPGKNLFLWFWYFVKAVKFIIVKNKKYPEILILEMGADKPGDIDYLTSIARPDIAVITAIGPSHLEYFKSIANVVREKGKIVNKLKPGGWAVINSDDDQLSDLIASYQGHLKTFGRHNQADVSLSDTKVTKKEDLLGTIFKLSYQGAEIPMFLPRVFGRTTCSGGRGCRCCRLSDRSQSGGDRQKFAQIQTGPRPYQPNRRSQRYLDY